MSRERSIPFPGMRIVLVFAIMLAAVEATATAATPLSPAQVQGRAALEVGIASELNRARAARGLPALRTVSILRSAARGHSRAMLELGFFAHDSADGKAFTERIRRRYPSRGWEYWSVGEALLAMTGERAEAPALVAAWLDSRPHRRIILDPTWRDLGVGAFYAPSAPGEFGSSEAIVVTADFGVRSGRAAAP